MGVSAVTGEGISEFFQAVDHCRAEYDREYKPFLTERQLVPPPPLLPVPGRSQLGFWRCPPSLLCRLAIISDMPLRMPAD